MTALFGAALVSAHLLVAAPAPAGGGNTPARSKSTKKSSGKRGRHAWRARGQKSIDEGRARQIQQALIREGYLDGKPNGQWDARSRDAMARYQADHGWQTRTVPDARALIKLGLGPATATPSPAESGPAAPAATPAGGEKSPTGAHQD